MDEEYGFIREKLDIKLLILYILRRLSGGVDISTICEICRVDGGVGYFDYSDCLSELTETGLIAYDEDNGRYMITPKGADDIDQVGSSLPFSVRQKVNRSVGPVNEKIKREQMIRTSYSEEDGVYSVKFILSDGVGEILNLKFMCSGEEQAKDFQKKFRKNAEAYYNKIIAMFTEE